MRTLSCLLLLTLFFPSPARADEFKIEPGFTSFFNGKDLFGWKLRKGGASLDGKSETAKKRFQVSGGKLIIDGKSRGNMVIDTAKQFGKDVHIKFEFLAGKGCNNDLSFRGLKFDIKKGGVKNLKVGEWQTFEIIVKGKQAEFKCDGELQRAQKTKSAKSSLGIRAEFGAIQYRRMRYKEPSS